MFKGGIAIFAFSFFFFSCASQISTQPPPAPISLVPTPPPTTSPTVPPPPLASPLPPLPPEPILLPDLTISDISLSEAGKVVVMILNNGEGRAAFHVGSLGIYIDGHLKWEDSLGNLLDQNFLQPGGFVIYTTPVELDGKHEVQAVADLQERIVEENEWNNFLTKVLGKEKIEAKPVLFPNLTITDLFLNPQKRLGVIIANIGDSPIPFGTGNLKVFIDGSLKGNYALKSVSDQSTLPSRGAITFITPLTFVGRHEILAQVDSPYNAKDSNEKSNSLIKILKGVPIGPDIVVKDLDLTEDLTLTIILSNGGEVDLRKGATFQIRILVNEQKISEFDHFISEVLKANHGNRYIIEPPYQVEIAGVSEVKVTILPKFSSDDILLENNILKRTFIIFPFKMEPKGREEFSFSLPSLPPKSKRQMEKVKAEARWEGGDSLIMLSFKKWGVLQGTPTFVGRNPLKAEIPIPDEVQDESVWSIFVANLVDRKVEGQLIIQHP